MLISLEIVSVLASIKELAWEISTPNFVRKTFGSTLVSKSKKNNSISESKVGVSGLTSDCLVLGNVLEVEQEGGAQHRGHSSEGEEPAVYGAHVLGAVPRRRKMMENILLALTGQPRKAEDRRRLLP